MLSMVEEMTAASALLGVARRKKKELHYLRYMSLLASALEAGSSPRVRAVQAVALVLEP